jgi:hypothetical protein
MLAHLTHNGWEVEVKEGSVAAHLLDGKFDFHIWAQRQILKLAPIWLASIAFHIIILLVMSAVVIGVKPHEEHPEDFTIDTEKVMPPLPEPDEPEFVETPIRPETVNEQIVERDIDEQPENNSNDEEDMITKPLLTPKGYGVIGIGGGWGDPNGRKPHGRGIRGTKKPPTEDAVLSALIWLARHQNADGSWSAQRFAHNCEPGVRCTGPGDEAFDVGLTGLALLAFTGGGYTTSSRRDIYEGYCFGDVVRKAANFLTGIQDSQGVYGSARQGKFMYNQAIAAYAIADLHGMLKESPAANIYKDSAQRGIDYLSRAQNLGKGWRYQPGDGGNDSSVTGWCAMALKSAEISGLAVDPVSFAGIKSFYDDVTGQTDGKVGYTELGSVAIKANEKDPYIQPSLTAIGIMVRIFIDKKATDPVIRKGVDLIMQSLPNWDTSKLGMIDYYYWFYGSYCLNQYDGPDGPCWKKWNENLTQALLKSQHPATDKCLRGSWDPNDRWSDEGSRIYATAINALTLEVYYRMEITRLK